MSRSSSIESLAWQVLCSQRLLIALVGVGVLLRIVQYAANRSLWVDEASLALNLIHRPLGGLVHRLDFSDAAPVGFVLLEGVVAKTLGYSEYLLRLVPLLAGLASLPAFAWLARRMLSRVAASFALMLFAASGALVYYSSEVKPYESDVAATVVLLSLGVLLLDSARIWTRGAAIGAGAAGLALLAVSFPAVFVVAAIATGYVADVVLGGWRTRLRSPASAVLATWILACLAVVVLAEANVSVARRGFEFGSGRFLGVPGSSPGHAVNYMGTQIASAIGFSQKSPYVQLEKAALVVAVLGAAVLLRRKASHAVMLLAPFPLLLLAAGVHAYPITERTQLFLVPAVVLLIAAGGVQAVGWLPSRARLVAAIAIAVAIGAGPVSLAATRVIRPQKHEELRPVLEFVRSHWRPGETLYVHYEAEPALLYYEECKCLDLLAPGGRRALWPLEPIPAPEQFDPAARPLGRDVVLERNHGGEWSRYLGDVNRLGRRRYVWFLYSHLSSPAEQEFVQHTLLAYLASRGRLVTGIDEPGAHAYLYRLHASHW